MLHQEVAAITTRGYEWRGALVPVLVPERAAFFDRKYSLLLAFGPYPDYVRAGRDAAPARRPAGDRSSVRRPRGPRTPQNEGPATTSWGVLRRVAHESRTPNRAHVAQTPTNPRDELALALKGTP